MKYMAHVCANLLYHNSLRVCSNICPPTPKYVVTWDVDVVLSYLRSLPDNQKVSFQLLSHKLAMLMALAIADRCSDLAALDLNHRTFQGGGVIPGLTKTRKSGSPVEAFYPVPEDPRFAQLKHCYENRSKPFRGDTNGKSGNPLFLSVPKPHKPVKPATLGHWL